MLVEGVSPRNMRKDKFVLSLPSFLRKIRGCKYFLDITFSRLVSPGISLQPFQSKLTAISAALGHLREEHSWLPGTSHVGVVA